MRVLVTGNRGYIGTIMVPMLQNRGHEVVGLDSDLYERSTFGDSVPEVDTINCDIRDANVDMFRGYDAVIHLAGLSNDPLGDFNPSLTEDINYLATIRAGELAKKAGVRRFIFSSSCSTYGAAGDDFLDETSEFNPVTPYGKSKVDSEVGLTKLADDEFTPVFMRSATAYGVSPRLRFDLVINNLTAWAFTTGQVLLKSDGTPWRPIVHIGDISRAFIAALEAPREAVHLQAFNVGRTDENFRIRELAEIVTKVVPGSHLEYAPGAGPDKRCYRVDCDKIKRVLPAFEPHWTARKGVEELYKAYCDVGLSLEDFEGQRFHRLAHLKYLIEERIIADDLRHLKQAAAASEGPARVAAGD
jgi:nucleoside-diphosphate-sugar epimerase